MHKNMKSIFLEDLVDVMDTETFEQLSELCNHKKSIGQAKLTVGLEGNLMLQIPLTMNVQSPPVGKFFTKQMHDYFSGKKNHPNRKKEKAE